MLRIRREAAPFLVWIQVLHTSHNLIDQMEILLLPWVGRRVTFSTTAFNKRCLDVTGAAFVPPRSEAGLEQSQDEILLLVEIRLQAISSWQLS